MTASSCQSLANSVDHLNRTIHYLQDSLNNAQQCVTFPKSLPKISVRQEYEWVSEKYLQGCHDTFYEIVSPYLAIILAKMSEDLQNNKQEMNELNATIADLEERIIAAEKRRSEKIKERIESLVMKRESLEISKKFIRDQISKRPQNIVK